MMNKAIQTHLYNGVSILSLLVDDDDDGDD
jgi:hypothetical protein